VDPEAATHDGSDSGDGSESEECLNWEGILGEMDSIQDSQPFVTEAIKEVRMIHNGKEPERRRNTTMDGEVDGAVCRLKAHIRDLRCDLHTLERYLSGEK
jgi:hypothetical protein